MSNENGPPGDKWPETIRDLIKHENELIANRLTWTATFQGFLFTALAFSWDKGEKEYSLVILLCFLGMVLALLSFYSLYLANKAIARLLDKWDVHVLNKYSPDNDLPPVWGGNRVSNWLSMISRIVKAPWSFLLSIVKALWSFLLSIVKAPWLLLPIVLFIAWGSIWYHHSPRLEPQWESLAQESFKQALSHDKSSDLAKQAITALAHIRGTPDEGMKVFNDHCVSCHGEPKVDFKRAATAEALVKEARNLVIVTLVGTKLHIRIFDVNGNIIVNKEEDESMSAEKLTALKKQLHQQLTPLHQSFLSQEQKQNIIQDVKLITNYPQSSDKTILKLDEFKKMDRKDIVSGILYSNPHKEICRKGTEGEGVTCMEDGLTTLMSPKEFIDVVEYLKEPKPKKVMQ